MEMIYLSERREKDAFAERAAKYFAEHPDINSFTDGEIEPGVYFAMRWGLGKDCVVVFRIADEPVTNYANLVPRS